MQRKAGASKPKNLEVEHESSTKTTKVSGILVRWFRATQLNISKLFYLLLQKLIQFVLVVMVCANVPRFIGPIVNMLGYVFVNSDILVGLARWFATKFTRVCNINFHWYFLCVLHFPRWVVLLVIENGWSRSSKNYSIAMILESLVSSFKSFAGSLDEHQKCQMAVPMPSEFTNVTQEDFLRRINIFCSVQES